MPPPACSSSACRCTCGSATRTSTPAGEPVQNAERLLAMPAQAGRSQRALPSTGSLHRFPPPRSPCRCLPLSPQVLCTAGDADAGELHSLLFPKACLPCMLRNVIVDTWVLQHGRLGTTGRPWSVLKADNAGGLALALLRSVLALPAAPPQQCRPAAPSGYLHCAADGLPWLPPCPRPATSPA